MGEMMRWDIINKLIEENGYKSYLEIGYYKGWSFDRIQIPPKGLKIAVDPNPSKTKDMEGWISSASAGYMLENNEYSMFQKKKPEFEEYIFKTTSDEFFENLDPDAKFDIIFIDGLHDAGQVSRDIDNAYKHLRENGRIVLHDANPPLYLHTTSGLDGCWTGDVYKAVAKEFLFSTGYTIDSDWGVAVIEKRLDHTSEHDNLIDLIYNDWYYFNDNRKLLLNLISPQEFLNKFKDGEHHDF